MAEDAEMVATTGREPIPMLLACPSCHAPHLDEGIWATRPHRTHQCQLCGHEWRPALVPTVGVAELPETA